MDRLMVVPMIGRGTNNDPWRADAPGSWVMVDSWKDGCMIRTSVADDATKTSAVLADIEDAKTVKVEPVSSQFVTAAKTTLASVGVDTATLDTKITDSKALLEWFVKARGLKLTEDQLLSGYSVGTMVKMTAIDGIAKVAP